MAQLTSTPEFYQLLADRFKALSEPARVQLLHTLEHGEMAVTELVEATGLGQANVSKHLRVLHEMGFVRRRKVGLFVHYALADRQVMALCDLMCGRLDRQLAGQEQLLGSGGMRR